MNLPVVLGSIVFIIWSIFCNWWYVCEINGLCAEPTEELADNEAPGNRVEPIAVDESNENEETDTTSVNSAVESLPEISISEDNILFIKNTTEYVDPDLVTKIFEDIVSGVEGRDFVVTITGHTCNRGSDEHNEALSLQRSKKVSDDLRKLGMAMDNVQLEGLGETSPMNSNSNPSEQERNRRVEIKINSIEK